MTATTRALPSLDASSPGILAATPVDPDRAEAIGSLWSLITALQKTLELDPLVALIHQQVLLLVDHSGCRFRNPGLEVDHAVGVRSGHRCALQLAVEGEVVGEISFYRHRRFSAEEQALLENLCSLLHFPLRNAVAFALALRGCRCDSLTGIGNRAALEEALRRELELYRRRLEPFAVLVLDLDHFKQVNDRHGHLAGDRVLRTVADTIGGNLRSTDLLFRYGGEEFVALLSRTTGSDARRVGERVRRRVERLSHGELGVVPSVTISIGCAAMRGGDSAHGLLERADWALYQAKNAGRNQVHLAA